MNRRCWFAWACILALAATLVAGGALSAPAPALADDPTPPSSPVKLIFVHHSTGENWLADGNGNLGVTLRNNNYFVSDTNYGWGPDSIGDRTDLGHWWDWFRGEDSATYLAALYAESGQHSSYSRLAADPGGPNEIILFKSCFPNSAIGGNPTDPPTVGDNPMRGEWCCGESYTVGNVKGIYNDILQYFATRQDKLFVVIVTPPLTSGSTDAAQAANARALANWLVNDWLDGYAYQNVAVFDFYNVLTSNGGSTNVNDLGAANGNHHRWWNGAVQHLQTVNSNYSAYGSSSGDSHPTAAGNQKASAEFVPLLNVFYHRWKGATQPTPSATVATPTRTPTRTVTRTATPGTPALTLTPTRTPTVGTPTVTRTSAIKDRAYLPLARSAPRATPTRTPTAATPTATFTPQPVLCSGAQPPWIVDTQVRQMPALAEPAARAPFRDPVFGACLVRVTDRNADLDPGDPSEGITNEYSRVQAFNADGSRLIARSIEGNWYLYDAETLAPLEPLPLGVEPRWSASDPDVVYHIADTRLLAYNVATHVETLVRDFYEDFPGQNIQAVWTRYEGSPSRDGRYWGLMAEDESWNAVAFLIYDLQEDQIIAQRAVDSFDVDSVTISPLGNYFLAFCNERCEGGASAAPTSRLPYPCGLLVFDRNLDAHDNLLPIVGHADVALDAQGREVLVYQDIDTDHIAMLDLATGAITNLWEIDFSHTSLGLHFSGRAFDRPGWAVVSTYNGGHPTDYTWMDDQVFAVELRAGGRVVRLAHHHSVYTEGDEQDYWAEPHATANQDLTRILFSTNWGRTGTNQTDMFMIDLPANWVETLP